MHHAKALCTVLMRHSNSRKVHSSCRLAHQPARAAELTGPQQHARMRLSRSPPPSIFSASYHFSCHTKRPSIHYILQACQSSHALPVLSCSRSPNTRLSTAAGAAGTLTRQDSWRSPAKQHKQRRITPNWATAPGLVEAADTADMAASPVRPKLSSADVGGESHDALDVGVVTAAAVVQPTSPAASAARTADVSIHVAGSRALVLRTSASVAQ